MTRKQSSVDLKVGKVKIYQLRSIIKSERSHLGIKKRVSHTLYINLHMSLFFIYIYRFCASANISISSECVARSERSGELLEYKTQRE